MSITGPNTDEWPLIPRKRLLGNPSRIDPKLSPDGRRLAWQAPVDGVMNIWVAPTDEISQAQPVTRLGGRPPGWHGWSTDGRFVLFLKDENGDENYNLYAVDPTDGEVRNLTPLPKANVRLYLLSPDLPGTVWIGLNDRDARWHDVWSLDLASGERNLVYENTERFGGFLPDWQGNLRLAFRSEPANGGEQSYLLQDGRWEPWRFVPFEDLLGSWPIFFNRAGTHLSAVSSIGRDTTALIRIDMATGAEEMLAEHPAADISGAIHDPLTREIDAVAVAPIRQEWTILDPDVAETLAMARQASPGGRIQSTQRQRGQPEMGRDLAWPAASGDLSVDRPRQADAHGTVHRAAGTEILQAGRHAGGRGQIARRAGFGLLSDLAGERAYVRVPPRRCRWFFWFMAVPGAATHTATGAITNGSPTAAMPCFRSTIALRPASGRLSSTRATGNTRQRCTTISSTRWNGRSAKGSRYAKRSRSWAGSYGGYASFVGATFTPEVFCCAVPIVGITDLVTLMENRPPYWADLMEQFHRRYADVRTEEGRAFLRSRSPLYKADQIRKPMLIGHGANDVRCTLAQSDAIVAAMQKLGLPVTYVVFPDEGHGFARPENNLAFSAIVEAFLARWLGGRAEPIGEDFAGSSHEIRAGAEFIQGLPA